MTSSLNTENLLFEEKNLFVPSLEEIVNVLSIGLRENFEDVSVNIVDCPNLEEEPFHLAAAGLNGSQTIIEIGGPPYLLPLVDRTKLYDLKECCNKVYKNLNKNEYLAIGAGAGPWPHVNVNCEGIYNLHVNGDIVKNESHLSRVNDEQLCVLEKIPNTQTQLALLGNIFLCEGKPGRVLQVKCKKRIGTDDFIASIRKTLANKYEEKTVGLGGVFLLKNGKAKQHVMSDFSSVPINTEEELNTWLKFYEMPAVLIALGTLITNDADLDLRLQHFHSFSKHGVGGHYHIDTTPDIVEYEGYFNVGERIVRIDKPLITHQFGRD